MSIYHVTFDTRSASGRFLVLLALAHGPKHGYEVARFLDERSGGVFTMSFGALYPVLHRLEAEGLARATWSDDGPQPRKVYGLTTKGEAALQSERADFAALAAAIARLEVA